MAIEEYFRQPALERYRSNLAGRDRGTETGSGWPSRMAVMGVAMLATVSLGFGLAALTKLPVAGTLQYRCVGARELIVHVVGSPDFLMIPGEAKASHRLLRSAKYPEGWLGVQGPLQAMCDAAGDETQDLRGVVF